MHKVRAEAMVQYYHGDFLCPEGLGLGKDIFFVVAIFFLHSVISFLVMGPLVKLRVKR